MPKVYVIDDSSSVRFAIERMLRARGLEVVSESSGEAALANLEREAPDLVLCDLVLPDLDGFEICSFVRGHPTLAKTPILVISGIVDDEIREHSRRIGAVGVLEKPFATEELVALVERVLADPGDPPTDVAGVLESPDARLLARLEARLEPLAAIETLRFACIVSPDGQIVGFGPHKPEPADVAALPELARLAALSTFRLGHGDLGLTTIESDRGILALLPQEKQHFLVLGLGDASVLGKTRFLLRRLRLDMS